MSKTLTSVIQKTCDLTKTAKEQLKQGIARFRKTQDDAVLSIDLPVLIYEGNAKGQMDAYLRNSPTDSLRTAFADELARSICREYDGLTEKQERMFGRRRYLAIRSLLRCICLYLMFCDKNEQSMHSVLTLLRSNYLTDDMLRGGEVQPVFEYLIQDLAQRIVLADESEDSIVGCILCVESYQKAWKYVSRDHWNALITFAVDAIANKCSPAEKAHNQQWLEETHALVLWPKDSTPDKYLPGEAYCMDPGKEDIHFWEELSQEDEQFANMSDDELEDAFSKALADAMGYNPKKTYQKAGGEKKAESTDGSEPSADPVKIKEYLDRFIVGQDEAKESIAMAISNQMLAYRNHFDTMNETTLIYGPTGCGKTMIARIAAEYAGLPITIVDASQITQDGFRGLSKDSVIRSLYDKSSDPEKAEYGIVVLDEFDKLTYPSVGGSGVNYAVNDQQSILGMLDGTPVMSSSETLRPVVPLKTRNILFILTGAYNNVYQYIDDKKTTPIGFDVVNASKSTAVIPEEDMRKALLAVGVIPELVGRIGHMVAVRELSEGDVYDAVINKEDNVIAHYRTILGASGKTLEVEDEYIRRIIRQALAAKLGIRDCRNRISDELRKRVYESYKNNEEVVKLGER